jgi:hypothetical protein
MTERVYLHVGSPKSGTTYLQRVLRHNQEELGRQGVLVAGRTHGDLVHAGFVVREDPRLARLPERASGAWDRLVEEVRGFRGHTAIISYELLSAARRRQAAEAIESLDSYDVHVVITCRDLGRAVPSAWQERLKFALTVPLDQWQPPPESKGPRAEWGHPSGSTSSPPRGAGHHPGSSGIASPRRAHSRTWTSTWTSHRPTNHSASQQRRYCAS